MTASGRLADRSDLAPATTSPHPTALLTGPPPVAVLIDLRDARTAALDVAADEAVRRRCPLLLVDLGRDAADHPTTSAVSGAALAAVRRRWPSVVVVPGFPGELGDPDRFAPQLVVVADSGPAGWSTERARRLAAGPAPVLVARAGRGCPARVVAAVLGGQEAGDAHVVAVAVEEARLRGCALRLVLPYAGTGAGPHPDEDATRRLHDLLETAARRPEDGPALAVTGVCLVDPRPAAVLTQVDGAELVVADVEALRGDHVDALVHQGRGDVLMVRPPTRPPTRQPDDDLSDRSPAGRRSAPDGGTRW